MLSDENDQILLILLVVFFAIVILTYSICKPRQVIVHPTHVNDLAAVVKWTLQNINDFGGDPSRIFLLGHSAGSIISLLACNPEYLNRIGVSPKAIKGVICLSGVFSDRRLKKSRIGKEILTLAFGERENYIDAFPMYNVTPETPPHFLINANVDYSLKRHTWDFYFVLKSMGVYCKSKIYANTNHFNIRKEWFGRNKQILEDIMEFIKQCDEYAAVKKII